MAQKQHIELYKSKPANLGKKQLHSHKFVQLTGVKDLYFFSLPWFISVTLYFCLLIRFQAILVLILRFVNRDVDRLMNIKIQVDELRTSIEIMLLV